MNKKSSFSKFSVPYATGSSLNKNSLDKGKSIILSQALENLCDDPAHNTAVINETILKLYENGGGNVVIGAGSYPVYTIELKSNVNLIISEGAVLVAALADKENYLEPEVRLYAGIQDHGHMYFRNSLIYAENEENIMISGPGSICGKRVNEDGYVEYVLSGEDPDVPDRRDEHGHKGKWFANKAIAIINSDNVILKDFSVEIGGHFAVIATGVDNLLIDNLLVDTNRDAIDIDCCRNVTVRNSICNSLTDDAIVIKASYGAGKFMPVYNVLVEDCKVSGYDAGSVINGTYTTNKKVAEDKCGPTGRVKLGTESTCGYDLVTIRNIEFDRSRGLALESVDGSPLTNIHVENIRMRNISSSPIFLRVGDRGRYPVTGEGDSVELKNKDIRLDNTEWVIPKSDEYDFYPPRRYKPSYNRDYKVDDKNGHEFYIVNPNNPTRVNPLNPDEKKANACGYSELACIKNVIIKNIIAIDVDRRYPILLAGLVDSKIENVEISGVKIEYRGGLSMEDAVMQKQEYKSITYSQSGTAIANQDVPLMVNPFFLKSEGLLRRQSYDKKQGCMIDDPFNVPELADSYPEPSQFGILPAYGIYVRHACNIRFEDIELRTMKKDTRCSVCLDDVSGVDFIRVSTDHQDSIGIATVRNNYKRHTNMEYVKNEPYFSTEVDGIYIEALETDGCLTKHDVKNIVVNSPSPGTPEDELYQY